MRKRPISVTIMGWLFIAAGAVGLLYHATGFGTRHPLDSEFFWICSLRLLAILGGVFLLRGRNWARWLLVVWLGYHVALSVLHAPFELVVHSLLFVLVLYLLFRSRASAYFRGMKMTAPGPE